MFSSMSVTTRPRDHHLLSLVAMQNTAMLACVDHFSLAIDEGGDLQRHVPAWHKKV